MRKRADEIIGVILEVYRVAATRNGLLAKPVDRGLDTNIGYGKHNALQPRGNTDSEYPFQVFEAEFGLLAPHAKHVVFHNKHDNEHGANDVGNYGSERNARDDAAWRTWVLPQAVLEVKQAVGRLLRKADDQGIVVLADARLLSKSYGKVFMRSMPSNDIRVLPCAQIVAEIEARSR